MHGMLERLTIPRGREQFHLEDRNVVIAVTLSPSPQRLITVPLPTTLTLAEAHTRKPTPTPRPDWSSQLPTPRVPDTYIHLSCSLLIYLKISNVHYLPSGGNSMIIIDVFRNVVTRDGGVPNWSKKS